MSASARAISEPATSGMLGVLEEAAIKHQFFKRVHASQPAPYAALVAGLRRSDQRNRLLSRTLMDGRHERGWPKLPEAGHAL